MKFEIIPGGSLGGEIQVAPDKSISHRSVILGAISSGLTRVENLLQGEDVLATIAAFRNMGVTIQQIDEAGYAIQGVGLHGLRQPSGPLDMGNSGTAFRLITGLMCGQAWPSVLIGDDSLSSRPMGRIIDPLKRMGAVIDAINQMPPLNISPVATLMGIHYHMPIASAQVKSCLLLAGMYADGETTITEPAPTRDHTERMLAGFGYPVAIGNRTVSIRGGGELTPRELEVPADLSSAAFFMVGASIMPGSDLLLKKVGTNPSRSGVLGILNRMGADIELVDQAQVGGEPVADIRIRAAQLGGCRVAGDDIALSIDEIPAIAVAAAYARGTTEILDAGELRVKESDRISSVVSGLRALGVSVDEHADGFTVHGGKVDGGQVDSRGDHRIAMAFSMAGGAARGAVEVSDCENVATSFPGFSQLARRAGLSINVA